MLLFEDSQFQVRRFLVIRLYRPVTPFDDEEQPTGMIPGILAQYLLHVLALRMRHRRFVCVDKIL